MLQTVRSQGVNILGGIYDELLPGPRILWLIIVRVRGRSPRTSTIIAIISKVMGYNYFISYLLIP